jgi:hypothetical protein
MRQTSRHAQDVGDELVEQRCDRERVESPVIGEGEDRSWHIDRSDVLLQPLHEVFVRQVESIEGGDTRGRYRTAAGIERHHGFVRMERQPVITLLG